MAKGDPQFESSSSFFARLFRRERYSEPITHDSGIDVWLDPVGHALSDTGIDPVGVAPPDDGLGPHEVRFDDTTDHSEPTELDID